MYIHSVSNGYFMFEHHSQPLLSYKKWLKRVFQSVWLAVMIVTLALLLGIFGYHFIGEISWIDSILEASMILGGMGAVSPMKTDAVKLFASFYALLSGLVILTTTGIIIAPWLHRLLHHFHHTAKNPKKKHKE